MHFWYFFTDWKIYLSNVIIYIPARSSSMHSQYILLLFEWSLFSFNIRVDDKVMGTGDGKSSLMRESNPGRLPCQCTNHWKIQAKTLKTLNDHEFVSIKYIHDEQRTWINPSEILYIDINVSIKIVGSNSFCKKFDFMILYA